MEGTTSSWALVTGASNGIGLEVARILAREGWNLAITARRQERLAEVATELAREGAGRVEVFPLDLSLPGSAEALHRGIVAKGLCIDLLVNNAGRGSLGRAFRMEASTAASMLELNVISLTLLAGLFGGDMAMRGRGRILNVASLAARGPLPFFAAYAASKSYVESFSLALRAELRATGVSVTCLLPGYVRTGFDSAAGIESPAYLGFSSRMGMEARAVAKAGLQAAFRNRARVVAGGGNKVAAFFMGLAPKALLPRLMLPFLERMALDGKGPDGGRDGKALPK